MANDLQPEQRRRDDLTGRRLGMLKSLAPHRGILESSASYSFMRTDYAKMSPDNWRV
jgi:hypothetical protein